MGYVNEKQLGIRAELHAMLPRLHKFAAALTGARHASLELTRITCQAAMARAAREKGQTPLMLWVCTQMHTSWMARMATRAAPRREEAAEPELFHVAPQGQAPSAYSAGMAKFLAHLPAQQRATLMLVYGLGFSYDEAAEVFGVQVSTVMTRLVRGHASLARWLEHRGVHAGAQGVSAPPQARARHARDYEERAA